MRPCIVLARFAGLVLTIASLTACPGGSGGGSPVIPGSGTIAGHVRLDGEGVTGIVVTMRRGGSVASTAGTTAGGAFQVSGLPPGPYEVSITALAGATCGPLAQTVEVIANQTVVADFDCQRPKGTVIGRVTRGEAGIAGASVQLAGLVQRTATTDATGAFSFGDIPAGSYTLSVQAAALTCTGKTVTVEADRTVTSDVACVPAPGTLRGQVTVDGEPPAAAVVVAARQGLMTPLFTITGAAGQYEFSELAPGSYSVVIDPPLGVVCATRSGSVSIQSEQVSILNFFCTAPGGSPPAAAQLRGAWTFSRVRTNAEGNCPSALPVEAAVAIDTREMRLVIENLFPNAAVEGTYDPGFGTFVGSTAFKSAEGDLTVQIQGLFFESPEGFGFEGSMTIQRLGASACTESYVIGGRRG